MHPVAGPVILAALLFFIFQAVFSWAAAPMELVDAGVSLGRRAAARRRCRRARCAACWSTA